ncbi:MAG TPA: DEAD/DEAH box helicase [Bdellovibrionales bacterium]|nr:MAG: DEAD/DEAH box helicase [Bdellovibrionales bacterium GWB1_52_6]OFZ02388.1 MAG: DEAD/DEAH box helicase [Bdellovibrionales bacterium GWA1_52_35]OFZ40885.1 MAG: DEAD/DEAH box helicase [Bdellovibrionales bacterium GWC1_52_8]HAR43748.1 DEAD/DEAH box helicase [Bdellovibrionales bacterium]HCM41584.1 DEAD/DEAH box helicase [Bdellovibrionales bacterium]
MKFESLKLIDPLLQAVKAEGYLTPTPIQVQAIPPILERRDILACAQTGTGKTAAFALPILQLLTDGRSSHHREIRVLVLTPTRELASQIGQSFSDYGKTLPVRNAVVFGGVPQHSQVRSLRQGVDILVATPGRLLDLMQQKLLNFRKLEIFVLDEADRMLDMGFIHDVRAIISKIPKDLQTLFFSATMPPEISKLSEQILTRPVRIEVTPVASTVEKVTQNVYFVHKKQKTSLLIHLLQELEVSRALVFTRTKRDANRVTNSLCKAKIKADTIHGDKPQAAREKALANIKEGKCRVLVATDIAARGIDIDQVTHVFNYDIPNIPESYVHRIGRTARAGAEGAALSFCAPEEREYLTDIEGLIKKILTVKPTPDGLEVETHGKKRPTHAVLQSAMQNQAKVTRVYSNPPPSKNNRRERRKKAQAAAKSGKH